MAKQTVAHAPASRRVKFNRAFLRRVARRIEKNSALTRGLKVAGISFDDAQADVREALLEVPALNTPPEGQETSWCSPWVADLVMPKDGGDWTAIVYACDGNLYAVTFSITDGDIALTGDPQPVEKTTDYEFISELTGERAAASPANPPATPAASAPAPAVKSAKPDKADAAPAPAKVPRSKATRLYRFSRVEEADEDGAIQVAFSSEYPVLRKATDWHVEIGAAKKKGERFYEVLSHDAGDADLSQLNNRGAFLDEHDTGLQLGHVRKASMSDDRKARAVLVPDEVTDLSKTRAQQIRSGSRPHISFGYMPTAFLGDDTLADGTEVKRFAWSADEISSVACPADPTVGSRRDADMGDDDSERAHCLHCAGEFDRSELDDNFQCADCVAAGRSKTTLKRDAAASAPAPVDLTPTTTKNVMPENTILLTESEAAVKAARTKATTDILARNKRIADTVDGWCKDHGMRKNGQCGEALRKIGNEFCLRDDSTPTESLLTELGARCLQEQAKFPAEPYLSRAKLGERTWARFSVDAAIKDIIKNERSSGLPDPKSLEGEVHADMERHAAENGGLGYSGKGFHVPPDAPVPWLPGRRSGRNDRLTRYTTDGRMQRDMTASEFTGGGAMVPTQLLVPIIELLRNRSVLDWAGTRYMGGLSGNIVIPRQTSAVSPTAIAEVAALQASQPTFDQVRGEPHRVGNTTVYSKQLLLQSSPDVEAVIHDDNAKTLALIIDSYGVSGTGAGSQPLGIMNTPGVNSTVLSATPTLAQIIQAETAIRQNNINEEVVFLATSSSRGLLMSSPAALTGSTVVSGQTNALWVAGAGGKDDTMVGRAALDSQQIPATTLVTGAFEIGLLGLMWGGVDVVVDYWTLASSGEIKLTYNTYVDFIVRHPQAFTVSTGMSQ